MKQNIRRLNYNCLTTTSFKVDQQYTIFPEAFRIYRYLLRQWNQFTTFEMMDSDDLLAALESAAFIRDYNCVWACMV